MLYDLLPFAPDDRLPAITVNVERAGRSIILAFEVSGRIPSIAWPVVSESPLRKTGLWEHTCFECFVGPEDSPYYLEFNLSPAGDWNAFEFDDVRSGMRQQPGTPISRFESVCSDQSAGLEADLELPFAPTTPLRVGLSAVIEDKGHSLHYFALTHSGSRPDFHKRENHILKLEN